MADVPERGRTPPRIQPEQQLGEASKGDGAIRRTMLTLTLVLALALTAATYAAGPSLSTLTAERIVQTWRCQDQLGAVRTRPAESPWRMSHHTVAYRRWVLQRWTARRDACLEVLHERARQWNWQQWLPAKWVRIARCETGMRWDWNSGRYQGSFGFAVSSWDAFRPPGYPSEAYLASPWEQYQVALAIYRRYGLSGWGCRNA